MITAAAREGLPASRAGLLEPALSPASHSKEGSSVSQAKKIILAVATQRVCMRAGELASVRIAARG